MKKQPEVTAKTRKKIMNAFWEVYKELRIEKITVGAVAKKAQINRGTFYEYFIDMHDLIDQIEDELLGDITNYFDEKFMKCEWKDFNDFYRECVLAFTQYGDRFYVLLSEKGDPAFQVKLKNRMRKYLKYRTEMMEDRVDIEYLLTFVMSSMSGILGYWYESGKEMGVEELVELLHVLVSTGVFGYMNQTSEECTELVEKMHPEEFAKYFK